MKTQYAFLLLFFSSTLIAFGQKKYAQPDTISGIGYHIVISNIQADKSSTQFRLELENSTEDEYFAIDPRQIGIEFPGNGTLYYDLNLPEIAFNKIVVSPGEKKSKIIRVMGDFNHKKQDDIKIKLGGFKRGRLPNHSVAIEDYEIEDGYKGELEGDGFILDFRNISANKKSLIARAKLSVSATEASNHLFVMKKGSVTAVDTDGNAVPVNLTTLTERPIDADSGREIFFKIPRTLMKATLQWNDFLTKVILIEMPLQDVSATDEKVLKKR